LDPPWISQLSGEELQELRRRADLALAQRQLAVGAAYLVFFSFFSYLTPYSEVHTVQCLAIGLMLLAMTALRFRTANQIVDRQARDCARQRMLYRAGTMGIASVWACFTFDVLRVYDQTPAGYVVLVGVAGLTNGATSALCTDLRLALSYMTVMMAPVFVWALSPDQGTLMGLSMATTYLAFLASLSRRQNFAVLSGFHDNMRLEVQARELLRAKEMAETATVAKGRFLAAMSHEIRTPLSGVIGLLNLLSETQLSPQQHELTRSIQHSGEMLLTIVNDILDYSKINAGKLVLENAPFEIRTVVTGLIEPHRRLANLKSVILESHVSSAVPEWVEGDPTRLKQVLNNLVHNAVKFTQKGKIQVLVHLEGARIRFSVRDTGIGIEREALPRLFDEFSQADQSTTRKFGGTGLGLTICKKLVEAMGGEIGVDSEPGQGSLFWFALPLRVANAASMRATISQKLPAARLRILIAEDNAINQRIICHAVEKLGHEAALAASGAEALEKFHAGEFDLILMDCQMPDMDGMEATRRIRQSGSKGVAIPIIAVTANAFAEDREACLAAGMTDHIGKPVQLNVLHAVIERSMGILEKCSYVEGSFSQSLGSLSHQPMRGFSGASVAHGPAAPESISGD
jgi:signal transduction histidine kinase/CheY-like chemotaxis protein